MMSHRRILLDGLAFETGDGGFTTAFRDLIETVSRLHDADFIVICRKGQSGTLKSRGMRVIEIPFPRLLRYFIGQIISPVLAIALRCDLIHCEISAPPVLSIVKTSVTVHDLYFLIEGGIKSKGLKGKLMNWYWMKLFTLGVRRASQVKVISDTTRLDVAHLLNYSGAITTIFPRVGPFSTIDRPAVALDGVIKILVVGSIVPRKNTPFILRALKSLQRPWQLNIVGQLWWGTDELAEYVDDARVKVHGFVTDEELELLYRTCDVLVSPSLYEGFGLPVAEAMLRGMPVLGSDIPAYAELLPEGVRFSLDDDSDLIRLLQNFDDSVANESRQFAKELSEKLSPRAHIDAHAGFFSEER